MQSITVEKQLNKPIEQVFAALSDHANYGRFPGVTKARLLREGSEEPNGKGALRLVQAGMIRLEEEITAFERPHLMEYRITRSFPLKIDHLLGQIKLEADGDTTRVTWRSDYIFPVPLLGGFIEKQVKPQFAKGFAGLLRAIEQGV